MNRIAAALGVDAAELVQLPQDTQLTITALLSADGAAAPTRVEQALTARPGDDMVAVRVTSSIGDYRAGDEIWRSEEHTSELQSLMRISSAVFCLNQKNVTQDNVTITLKN